MKIIKYFFEFISVISLFCIFKVLGLNNASNLGGLMGRFLGPLFRSKNIVERNIEIGLGKISENQKKNISHQMWSNIGRTFAEYVYLKEFRQDKKNINYVKINGLNYLKQIKLSEKPVIFFSGHFGNIELIKMQLTKMDLKFAALHRPVNNIFLEPIKEYLRLKYVCKNYISKGRMNVREIIKKIKDGYSIAIMVDQRISEGPRVPLFNKPAHTTTIPAQLALKYNCKLVPIFIERKNSIFFEMTVHEPFDIENTGNVEKDIYETTLKINKIIEKMILKNPGQWLWSHNRWK
jgi:KDO2-lipid IV(A) lauroyltransferase